MLGRGVVPADEPVLPADDLGVTHGDGLFETLHVRAGRPWLVDEHLTRMAGAAARIDLPLPEAAALVGLLDTVCAGWPVGVEGALRLVCTRGPESGGPPTVFATLVEVPAGLRRARTSGIGVATLPLGVTATARADLDWLPAGAKSLSYATSTAARRWASRHGVDDVLWTSTDGYALEGPTANLVWCVGGDLCTVPAATTGVLPGVTVRHLLKQVARLGLEPVERLVTVPELQRADGVWFTSSLRGLVKVHTLDGTPLARSPYTADLQGLLGFPRP